MVADFVGLHQSLFEVNPRPPFQQLSHLAKLPQLSKVHIYWLVEGFKPMILQKLPCLLSFYNSTNRLNISQYQVLDDSRFF